MPSEPKIETALQEQQWNLNSIQRVSLSKGTLEAEITLWLLLEQIALVWRKSAGERIWENETVEKVGSA